MKLEDLKQVAVNNIAHLNITLRDAKALVSFLGFHDIDMMGEFFVVPIPTQPSSQSKDRIPLSTVEGGVPEALPLTISAQLTWKSGKNSIVEISAESARELGTLMKGFHGSGSALNEAVRQTIGMLTNWQVVPLPMRNDVELVLWEACFGRPFEFAPPPVDTSKDNPAMPDAVGFLGTKTLFPGVFNLEPGDTHPVGTIKVAPDGNKYERLSTTWRQVS